jgi:hypothetical protein
VEETAGAYRDPLYFAGLSPAEVEKALREHAANLNLDAADARTRVIAFDGKALKGSFDNFNGAKTKQVLSAFAVDTALVLAHIEIDEKSNEIPAVQKLMEELDLADHIINCEAMHCQKNFPSRRRRQRASDRPAQGQPADSLSEGRGRLRHSRSPVERADSGPKTAQPARNPSHHGIRRRARRRGNGMEPHVAAIIKVERSTNVRQPATGLWKLSLETSFYIRPPHQRKPGSARHPQALGDREQIPLHA